jgi:hypothetical protein
MKVTITLTVDVRTADDINVFYSKIMQGNEQAACQHPQTMQFLAKAARAIQNAAGYQRQIERQAAGGA